MSDDNERASENGLRLLEIADGRSLRAILEGSSVGLEPGRAGLHVGQLVASRYSIERRLGSSAGTGLYRAFDRVLRELVAMKVVAAASPSEPIVRALICEARQARRIRHPNVCRVHDVGVHDPGAGGGHRIYFSTMELIDGARLRRVLRRGPLELLCALRIARQLLAGLGAAHEVGVQHGKLDTSRVLIGGHSPEPHVSLIEFGHTELTELSASDEWSAGLASDLQGFGLVLLEMLTGRSRAGLAKRASPPSTSLLQSLPERIPGCVREVIRRCLGPSPCKEFADVGAVLGALSHAPDRTRPHCDGNGHARGAEFG